jgi:peptidoglycan hydrolase CwlO-like protein
MERDDREQKIRDVVEQHLATHDALLVAQDDLARMRASLDLQRQRADHYQKDLEMAKAERDHYMAQVVALMTQMNNAVAMTEHLAQTMREGATDAAHAPFAGAGAKALQQVADNIEAEMPKFLQAGPATEY